MVVLGKMMKDSCHRHGYSIKDVYAPVISMYRFVSADVVDVVVPFLFEQMAFCGNGVAKDKETSLASAF